MMASQNQLLGVGLGIGGQYGQMMARQPIDRYNAWMGGTGDTLNFRRSVLQYPQQPQWPGDLAYYQGNR